MLLAKNLELELSLKMQRKGSRCGGDDGVNMKTLLMIIELPEKKSCKTSFITDFLEITFIFSRHSA